MSKWISFALVFSNLAFAAPTVVKCTGTYQGKVESVQVKLNDAGQIVMWDGKRYAKAGSKSAFWWFTQDVNESGIEWHKTFRAPNGYSIVQVGTMADSCTLGVNLKAGKGFFSYHDEGSGNGNYKFDLRCTR